VGKGKLAKLNLLPPTFEAAQQHLIRVYYQVQKWLCNELNPLDWGRVMRKLVVAKNYNSTSRI